MGTNILGRNSFSCVFPVGVSEVTQVLTKLLGCWNLGKQNSLGICLPNLLKLFGAMWCSASFLLLFCASALNPFFNSKINSKEICQHTYGNLRSLNQNPGGKPWENEQIMMREGFFIITNIHGVTKNTAKIIFKISRTLECVVSLPYKDFSTLFYCVSLGSWKK